MFRNKNTVPLKVNFSRDFLLCSFMVISVLFAFSAVNLSRALAIPVPTAAGPTNELLPAPDTLINRVSQTLPNGFSAERDNNNILQTNFSLDGNDWTELGKVKKNKKTEQAIFDQAARHSCEVRPFVTEIRAGSNTVFTVTLLPSSKTTQFTVELGDLPTGISASLNPLIGTTPPVLTVNLSAQPELPSGSFSLVLIYKERQSNGVFLPNFCQYNVIVR